MCEETGGGLVMVVVRGIAMAWTGRRMCVLDCTEQVHCPRSPLLLVNTSGNRVFEDRMLTVGAILTAAIVRSGVVNEGDEQN